MYRPVASVDPATEARLKGEYLLAYAEKLARREHLRWFIGDAGRVRIVPGWLGVVEVVRS